MNLRFFLLYCITLYVYTTFAMDVFTTDKIAQNIHQRNNARLIINNFSVGIYDKNSTDNILIGPSYSSQTKQACKIEKDNYVKEPLLIESIECTNNIWLYATMYNQKISLKLSQLPSEITTKILYALTPFSHYAFWVYVNPKEISHPYSNQYSPTIYCFNSESSIEKIFPPIAANNAVPIIDNFDIGLYYRYTPDDKMLQGEYYSSQTKKQKSYTKDDAKNNYPKQPLIIEALENIDNTNLTNNISLFVTIYNQKIKLNLSQLLPDLIKLILFSLTPFSNHAFWIYMDPKEIFHSPYNDQFSPTIYYFRNNLQLTKNAIIISDNNLILTTKYPKKFIEYLFSSSNPTKVMIITKNNFVLATMDKVATFIAHFGEFILFDESKKNNHKLFKAKAFLIKHENKIMLLIETLGKQPVEFLFDLSSQPSLSAIIKKKNYEQLIIQDKTNNLITEFIIETKQ